MSAIQSTESTATLDRADQSLGSIAVELPGATAVFRALKLDFCCHGNVSLRQAAQDKGLDLDNLVGQLAALQRVDALPDNIAPAALIDHIVARYHEAHRAQLPELVRMAKRVELVHANNPNVPAGLAAVLETMQADMFDHLLKEEQILFPLIKAGGHPQIQDPINVIRSEHIDHGAALDKINALTNDATPPPGACNTWRALYTGIGQFTDDLINHIHLENNVLFPAFEAASAPQKTSGGCGGGGGGCGCN